MRLLPLVALIACGPKTAPTPTEAVPVEAAAPAPTAAAAEAPAEDPALVRAREVVAAEDRDEADVALDAGRHPAELLALAEVAPRMAVGELMAGGGYTVELLARAVGSEGRVYGVNSPFILERFAEAPWTARLAKPVNANVTRLDRAFDDPFGEIDALDRVFSILVYHDFVWMETDRAAMNQAIFAALKPGGLYVVLDHSAEEGSAVRDVKSLHRIDEAVVTEEVLAAGFELVRESDRWRHAEDSRDWSASPGAAGDKRGQSDRFALVFRKPE